MSEDTRVASIHDLKPDTTNANKGTHRGRAMLETSVRRYGAGRSILVDKHNKIIAGNKTVEAAEHAGVEEVIIVPSDGTQLVVVQRTDLDLDTDVEAKELGVVDNQAGAVGLSWDATNLQELERQGVDMRQFFREPEWAKIVKNTSDAMGGDEIPDMALQPFEEYNYIVAVFKNSQDWQGACDLLGIRREKVRLGETVKVGLGRVGRRRFAQEIACMRIKVIIPSRKRADRIGHGSLSLFPDATVCVGESEVPEYSKLTKNLLVHGDEVVGLGILRQWILDHVEEEVVVMPDDDIASLYSFVGTTTRRITNPADVMRVIENAAVCAEAAGARVFGFNQGDIRKFEPQKPFSFNSWVGGLIGIIGRELKYDPVLRLHDDVDLCLQSLQKHRIIWQDLRFKFANKIFAGAGGNSISRSKEQHEKEIAYMKRKWGAHLQVRPAKTTIRLVVNVPR